MENEPTILFVAAFTAVAFIIIVIAVKIVLFVDCFFSERRYIKMEISRSANHDEALYWRHELKLLYLSYIPIVGYFVR